MLGTLFLLAFFATFTSALVTFKINIVDYATNQLIILQQHRVCIFCL